MNGLLNTIKHPVFIGEIYFINCAGAFTSYNQTTHFDDRKTVTSKINNQINHSKS